MQLAKLQQYFGDALLGHENTAYHADIKHDAISPQAHIGIYRHNVLSNISNALADTYAAIYKLVGEEYFLQLAYAFIAKTPPSCGDLNNYGAGFDQFITDHPVSKSLPYLADVARYEWAWNTSFFAPSDTALNPETLTTLAQEELLSYHFAPRASVQPLALHYPADDIWLFCERDNGEGTPPEIIKDRVYILLWRYDGDVEHMRINTAEYHIWAALKSSVSLSDALEELHKKEQIIDIEHFLHQAFTHHLFKDCKE